MFENYQIQSTSSEASKYCCETRYEERSETKKTNKNFTICVRG